MASSPDTAQTTDLDQLSINTIRMLAVDASKIAVQRAPELFDAFGAPECGFAPQVTAY